MNADFTFKYGTRVTNEQADELKVLCPDLSTTPAIDHETKKEMPGLVTIESYWQTFTADLSAIWAIVPDIALEVKGLSKGETPIQNTISQLTVLANKLSRAIVEPDLLYNKKVEVHVPGLGLLNINEVRVEEDCCTDNLQGLLEGGWRIIAACPQPDQRRPDYVLGRTV